MSSPLTIVARIEVEKDHVDFVKSELKKLIEPTLAEEGCIQYDLHQDHEESAVFLFFENWESRELWQKHMEADHLKTFSEVTEGKIANVVLNEMTKVRGM